MVHRVLKAENLYAEARRLLANGANPNDSVEFNGQQLNGTLDEIAGIFITVSPEGQIEITRTGAAALTSAALKVTN